MTKRQWDAKVKDGEPEIKSTELVWENEYVRVFNDLIDIPTKGTEILPQKRHVRIAYGKEYTHGVVVVPVTFTSKIVLVRQFRHAPRLWMWELPRGYGHVWESTKVAINRELAEETGYKINWDEQYPLGHVATDSGKLQDIPILTVARAIRREQPSPDITEVISGIGLYSYSELKRMCQKGEIIDMFTLAAVARLDPHFRDDDIFEFDKEFSGDSELWDVTAYDRPGDEWPGSAL